MKYLLIGLVTANLLLAGWNGFLSHHAVGSNLDTLMAQQPATRVLSKVSQVAEVAEPRDKLVTQVTESERNLGQSVQERPKERLETPVTDETQALAQCQLVGPYTGLAAVERVQQDLLRRGIDTLLREESFQRKETYLVYIPVRQPGLQDNAPGGSQAALLKELSALKVDAALIPRGALKGDVSVGVFRRREFADLQLQRVISLGYSGKLQPLVQEQKVFHLLVQNARQPLPDELHTSACAAIAQERRFL